MSKLSDLTGDVVPRSTRTCASCEATPAGCRGLRALRGSYCCRDCDNRRGDHDLTTPEGASTSPEAGATWTRTPGLDGNERAIPSRTDLPAPRRPRASGGMGRAAGTPTRNTNHQETR